MRVNVSDDDDRIDSDAIRRKGEDCYDDHQTLSDKHLSLPEHLLIPTTMLALCIVNIMKIALECWDLLTSAGSDVASLERHLSLPAAVSHSPIAPLHPPPPCPGSWTTGGAALSPAAP